MTAQQAPRRRPEGRYDAPSRAGQRVLAVILGALFLGLLAAIVIAISNRFEAQEVRGQVRGFDVRSDREVVIEVRVSKPEGKTAYCVVRARSADGAEVGRDIAVLDAVGTDRRTAQGTFSLATTARPVTGELAGCRVAPISRDDIEP